jgi:transcriptional regulator with XRE-family HTH domain
MPARRPDSAALQAWRQSRNWDQTATAHRLRAAAAASGDTTASLNSLVKMIYAWERGAYTITERYALLYAAALGVPAGELADGPPRQLTAIVSIPGPELPPGSLTNRDVEVIRRMLDSLTASDRQFGGNHALEHATYYLREIILPRLPALGPQLVIRDLHSVACEFTLRLASMHADAGDSRESRRMLGASFPLAEETGDPSWTAWVLARRGEQHLDDRDRPRRSRTHRQPSRWQPLHRPGRVDSSPLNTRLPWRPTATGLLLSGCSAKHGTRGTSPGTFPSRRG